MIETPFEKIFKRLFFAFLRTLATIKKPSEKTAPSVAPHNTKQVLHSIYAIRKEITNNQSVRVRWLEKWRSASFFLDFFVSFFVKKKRKAK